MKLIPLSEAKAHLSRYGRLCHDEPVIVTVPAASAGIVQHRYRLVDALLCIVINLKIGGYIV